MTTHSGKQTPPTEPVSATTVVFDIVRSKTIAAPRRSDVQQRIGALLKRWNRTYAASLLSGFMISLGDEYQGLITAPEIIPDLMWELEDRCADVAFRWGIGFGAVHTQLQRNVTAIDGPTFHNARRAIASAKKDKKQGGVYVGFPPEINGSLNGLARVLFHQRSRLTEAQREGVQYLRSGTTRTEAARALHITRQAMDQRAHSAGWPAYTEGETALRELLGSCNTRLAHANEAKMSRARRAQ